MAANGQSEVQMGTVLLYFKVVDFMLGENFTIKKKTYQFPHWPLLPAQKQYNFRSYTRHLTVSISFNAIKTRHTSNTTSSNTTVVENTYTLQPNKTLVKASRMPHLLGHDATGIVTLTTIQKPRKHFHHIVI